MSSAQVQLEAGGAGGRGRAVRLGLIVLCLVVYLPGFFSIPAVDRDESRFAQASRQMFESVALPEGQRDARHAGGLLMPMVQDRARLNKPPLIYWLQAGSAAVFTGGEPTRDAIWMYRVPSLVAGIVAVLVTAWIGASMFGAGIGALAGAMLAVCPMVAWEAHQARADMVLLAWTVGAMGAMWKVRGGETERRRDGEMERGGLKWPLVFWVCVAGGVMTKGPITLMVAGLAVLFLCVSQRRWRWVLGLRPLMGVCVVGAAVAPWVIAVAGKVGWGEYWSRVYDETIGRSLSSREGHWGPPGYHLVLLPVLFWPGSLLTGFAVVKAWRAARRGSQVPEAPGLLFCLAWALPAWVVFELIGTKLPHYTMPLYPALALLSARTIGAITAGDLAPPVGIVLRLMRGLWTVIGAVLCVGLPVGAWVVGVRDSWWIIPTALVWMLAVVFWVREAVVYSWAGTGRWRVHQVAGVVAIAGMLPFLFQGLLPRMKRVWVSEGVMKVVRGVDPEGKRALSAVGYHEDSLVFLTRGRVERIEEGGTGVWWAKHPEGLMVLPTERVLRIHRPVGEFWGFNYSKGRRERLSVVEHFRRLP